MNVDDQPPTNLHPINPLTILENQSIGTVVGDFNASDPDASSLTYSLVSGVGDGNNSLFSLESNGTLKSSVVFDYENNASTYSIRVQAKDDSNASVEGNFTISLLDGPNRTLTINSNAGGSTTGAGSYDLGDTASLTATPDIGYLFSGWSGDLTSSDLNVSVNMSANKEVNATFVQDTADSDGDGLSNYAELVTHSTDPNDSDSDDDGLTDSDETTIGLDPNTANTALMTFFGNRESTARSDGNTSGIGWVQANPGTYNLFTQAEVNASSATKYASGVSDGNTSGIAYVQANPGTYNLFTQAEVNASSASRYASGVSDGNTSGIAYVQANPASYQLFTLSDLNQSGLVSYAAGFADGNTSGVNYLVNHPGLFGYFTAQEVADSEEMAKKAGSAESLATVQADLASQNLSYVPFLEKMNIKVPHTHNWYYQPGLGWLWTTQDVFPHLYLSPDEDGSPYWLYFDPDRNESAKFYDYQDGQWKELLK
jgi:hypothetical protein